MKVIHAVWERRNLGIDCNEVLVDADDSVDALRARLPGFETDYTVVKVPMGRADITFALQSAGYAFIELITSCAHEARLPTLPPVSQRLVDAVQYREMNARDHALLFEQIESGLFREDRVSLDPHFTHERAGNRYVGWIQDEAGRGSRLYTLEYRASPIGFFNLRDAGDGVHVANLGGIYPTHQGRGFGISLNYYEIQEGIRRGARRIVSTFSSNNKGAFAVHLQLGYTLLQQFYVFVKHRERSAMAPEAQGVRAR